MTRPKSMALAALASLLLSSVSGAETVRSDRLAPIDILFLGDRGHHRPADRAGQLIPALEPRGIRITYTEDLDSLSAETLGKYDGLIVYANTTQITPAQERALLDSVASGKGFIPLHCASYCFLNSPKYIALVGAQFQRHGTGVFRTEVVEAGHPVMRDIWEFETWDETYVHTKHNPEKRTVLQVRKEGDALEPWTWVRTHGKGRVFYTAYGHDERTWGNPAFHALVERGIRWACGEDRVLSNGLPTREDFEPFEYVDNVKLPNYLPGKSWGTLGNEITRMQKPVSPERSQKHLVLPPGFEAKLFVSEPEIRKPIAINWDERGRLWVLETKDYPNDRQPEGQGNDQIKICEDTDNDGVADTFTVFADTLSVPTGLTFAAGGLIVQQAPHTLFLKDTDGDDRADERRALFTGWGTYDTHAGPSNLKWGFDNWIWGMLGYSGFNGEVGGEKHRFSSGFYRFRPDGSKLEFIRSTNNNTWGIGFSEDALVFGSTANNNPSCYMPIANRFYERVRGLSASRLGATAINSRFYPITDRVRQVDAHGRFTAGAGHALYTARAYPEHYWNRVAFVNGPTGHLTGAFTLERRGSDFVSRNSWNMVASDDEWTAPIMSEVGPDGLLWVVDWYNYIIQHNPTPRGFKTGRGNAYETELRDKVHGRIYRLVHEDSPAYTPMRLDTADTATLVRTLRNDNMFWRNHAQRLLVERGDTDAVDRLIALLRDESVDAIGLNTAAIHALWTLDGLGALDDAESPAAAAVRGALGHPSAGVRRNALRVLPDAERSIQALVSARSLVDPDAQVRLAAFLALSEAPPSQLAGAAIAATIVQPENASDRWIPDAATAAAARHDLHFLTAITEREVQGSVGRVVAGVAQHYARGRPTETIGGLVKALAVAQSGACDAIVEGLAKGWPADLRVDLDEKANAALAGVFDRLSTGVKGQIVKLAATWGSDGLERYASEITEKLLAGVRDAKSSDTARIEAARQVVDFRGNDLEVVEEVLEAITPRTSPTLAAGLVDTIGASANAEVGETLVAALANLTPTVRSAAVSVLMRRPGWTAALLDGLEEGAVQVVELSLDQKRALAEHPTRAIATRAKKILANEGGLPNADRQKVIDSILPALARTGDVSKGKLAFTEQCAKCHQFKGEGQNIGPDLTGMSVHPRDELLVHILDPSRSVEGNYRQYTVVTRQGVVINGLLASETKTTIELYDVEGKKHVITRADIRQFFGSPESLMPAGFETKLGEQGIVDLLEYLTQRGKFVPLPLDRAATIASDRGMFFSRESRTERLVFGDWSPKVFEGVPFRLIDPRGATKRNVIMLHGPNGRFPPEMPKTASVPCNTSAAAIHMLSGVSGWGSKGGGAKSLTMVVRLHYADGKTEDHQLRNAVHFADYIGHFHVPGSKFAFDLNGRQIRYLAIHPKRKETIRTIEFRKGDDRTAPVVMAVTVETADSE